MQWGDQPVATSTSGGGPPGVSRLVLGFALAGLIAGAISSAIVYLFAGLDHYPVVLGFAGRWHFFALAFGASLLAGLFAALVRVTLRKLPVGSVFGAIVALLTFLTITLLLGWYVAGNNIIDVFMGFTLFGAMIVGWLVVAIGALAGILLARMAG